MMLPPITTEIMRNNHFFTDAQNLWRKFRFHELGIRRMPSFFSLICTLLVWLEELYHCQPWVNPMHCSLCCAEKICRLGVVVYCDECYTCTIYAESPAYLQSDWGIECHP